MDNFGEFVKNNAIPLSFLGATVIITYATAKIASRSAAEQVLKDFVKIPPSITITKDFFQEARKYKIV